MVSSRPGRLAGSPVGRIVQHLPGGLRGVAQPLAILGGRGERRRIGHEPVETRQILEVTLRTPNMVASSTRLDHQRAKQGGKRKRSNAATEAHGDPPCAIKSLAGSRELRCAQRRDRGESGAPAHALGSDHVELETVPDELVAVPIDVDVGGV